MQTRSAWILAFAVLTAACGSSGSGSADGGSGGAAATGGTGKTGTGGAGSAPPGVLYVPYARLTRPEYQATIRAAFGVDADISGIPDDSRIGPFTSSRMGMPISRAASIKAGAMG